MKRVLFAWELGGGFGHISQIHSLGSRLERLGCELCYVLSRPPANAPEWFADSKAKIIQAPPLSIHMNSNDPVINYAEILLRTGFADADKLKIKLDHWRSILSREKPDLVVIDHSPQALIAAMSLGFPRVMIGNSFLSPPSISPFPSLQPWRIISDASLQAMDDKVLHVINKAISAFDMKPWNKLCQMFDGISESFLATFPELDNYPLRDEKDYWGTLASQSPAKAAVWNSVDGKKVYVYVKSDFTGIRQLLSQLIKVDANFLIHVPHLDKIISEHYSRDNVTFYDGAINASNIIEESDVVICHGNHNTVIHALQAGKPLLMLPYILEHMLTALCVEKYGAGLLADVEDTNKHPARMLQSIIDAEHFKLKASAFSIKYQYFKPDNMLDKAARRCMEILNEN